MLDPVSVHNFDSRNSTDGTSLSTFIQSCMHSVLEARGKCTLPSTGDFDSRFRTCSYTFYVGNKYDLYQDVNMVNVSDLMATISTYI